MSFKNKTESAILVAYTSPDTSDTDTQDILGSMRSHKVLAKNIDSGMNRESSVDKHEIAESTKSKSA